MSSWAIRTLRRVSSDLLCLQDGRIISLNVLEAVLISLELVYRDLIAQEQPRPSSALEDQACDLVRKCLQDMRSSLDKAEHSQEVTQSPPEKQT